MTMHFLITVTCRLKLKMVNKFAKEFLRRGSVLKLFKRCKITGLGCSAARERERRIKS